MGQVRESLQYNQSFLQALFRYPWYVAFTKIKKKKTISSIFGRFNWGVLTFSSLCLCLIWQFPTASVYIAFMIRLFKSWELAPARVGREPEMISARADEIRAAGTVRRGRQLRRGETVSQGSGSGSHGASGNRVPWICRVLVRRSQRDRTGRWTRGGVISEGLTGQGRAWGYLRFDCGRRWQPWRKQKCMLRREESPALTMARFQFETPVRNMWVELDKLPAMSDYLGEFLWVSGNCFSVSPTAALEKLESAVAENFWLFLGEKKTFACCQACSFWKD